MDLKSLKGFLDPSKLEPQGDQRQQGDHQETTETPRIPGHHGQNAFRHLRAGFAGATTSFPRAIYWQE